MWPDNDKAGVQAALNIEKILVELGQENVKVVNLPSTLPHKWDLADELPQGFSYKDLLALVPKDTRVKETRVEDTCVEAKVAEKAIKKSHAATNANFSQETFNDIVDRFKLVSLFSKPHEDHFKVATEVFKALESCAPHNQNSENLKERSVFMALRMEEVGNLYALEKPEALSRLLLESRLWQNLVHNGERVDMNLISHKSVGNLKAIEETYKQGKKSKSITEVHKFMRYAFGPEKNTASFEKERVNQLSLER